MKYLYSFLSTILHNSLVILVHSQRFTCTEKYVEVPVDHFSFSDNRTFALRYCINDHVWEPNVGPIFLYIGGETAIEHFIKNSGFVWESAIGFRALVVFAEHRFYGKSKPFGDLSYTDPKYFSYLSTQQALADFVDVVYHLREEKKKNFSHNQTHDIPNPVIAFGGSYGGVLAAWMRMKYPAIIEGSLASSAPVWGFSGMVSCNAFAKQLTSIYTSTYKLCSKNIQTFWNELARVAETDEGRSWLSGVWQLCNPLKTDEDLQKFRSLIEDTFKAAAMVNYPYSANFFTPLPANPVKEMCVFINKPKLFGNLLVETMRKAVSVYMNHTGEQSCFDWNVSAFGSFQMDAWNIQTCLDMVMPYCTNGLTDMFLPSNWTFQEWDDRCYLNYKLHPREGLAEKLYGGLNLDATSNIIFSNGELDPFISGGVKQFKLSSSIKTVVLAKAAHQLDLRATNVDDPPSVKRARESYQRTFVKWITSFYKKQATLHSELAIRLTESSTSNRNIFSWLSGLKSNT